jgi:hypothetical protein
VTPGRYEVRSLDHPERSRVVTILPPEPGPALIGWLRRIEQLEQENLALRDIVGERRVT